VVSRDIRRILTQRARYFNIVLDDVSITQLTFSRDYTAAVESKQVAQQDAERAKFVVRRASDLDGLMRLAIFLLNIQLESPPHDRHRWTKPSKTNRALSSERRERCAVLASADALHHWQSPCNRECVGQAAAACELNHLSSIMGAQAQSAKLIGDAIQKNPAFLTLRKIEVRRYCAEASLRMATLP
jgi:hypothetical protein